MNRAKYAIFSIIAVAAILGIGTVAAISQPVDKVTTVSLNPENLGVHGYFTLTVFDEFGNVKQTLQTPNTVVDTGIDCMSDLVFGTTICTSEAFFNYLQIGTGTTAPTSANTALETPIGGCARIQDGTVAVVSPTGEITATIEVTFSGATCAATVTEAGVFDALTSGNMLARKTFLGVTVGASDTLTVTYNIKIEMV